MGWASGSEIADEVWNAVRKYVPESDRKDVATRVVRIFEERDCDTMEEAEVLWNDADPTIYCWRCDKPFKRSELNGDYECTTCHERQGGL